LSYTFIYKALYNVNKKAPITHRKWGFGMS